LAKEIGNPQAVFQEQPIGVPLRITATAINPADESQPSAPVTLTLTQASEPRPPGHPPGRRGVGKSLLVRKQLP